MEQKIHIIEQEKPEVLLLQMTFAEELPTLQAEVNAIYQAVQKPFVLAAVEVGNWSHDLSPWNSPSISPREQLGDGAVDTLRALEKDVLPMLRERYGELPVVLGGYSLAGLFARWAVCKAECFDAVAAASPSLWIVAWQGFSDAHEVYARYVYLSLGDREEITKNKAIAQVGNNIRWEYDHLQRAIGSDHCTLVWEKGGHFVTPHLRLARAFAWCINSLTK
jgi:predicted alpha/beta superfamily hydrolase